MKIQLKSGFTIIEVMLFLAITGLLIAGILGGTQQSLNDQRYRTGVEQIRNTIRAQYATSLSLRNLTVDDAGGVAGANAVDPCSVIEDPDTPVVEHTARGASDCLYVGRIILLEADPAEKISRMKIYPVVAKVITQGVSGIFRNAAGELLPTVDPDQNVSDQNSLRVAAFTRNSNIVVDKQVDWGLVAVTPKPAESLINVGILVFRSPISGTIATYILDSPQPEHLNNLQDHMNPNRDDPDSNIRKLKLCMADLTGSLDPANRRAIIINAGASGPGDVETLGEAAEC